MKLLLLLPLSGMLFAIDADTIPGRALSLREEAIPEGEALVGRVVRRTVERDAHRQQVARIEAGLHALHADEASNEQRRPNEQHERQRDLATTRPLAQTLPRAAGTRAARARVAQRLVQVRARGLQRRHESEQNPRRDRDGCREQAARGRRS